MNNVSLIGNLTKDPESRPVGDTTVTTLRIAVNRRKPKDGSDAKTDFIDIKVWGVQGDNCVKYLAKGKKVAVEGRLQIDEVERRDGNGKAHFVSVIANQVHFLSPSETNGATPAKPEATSEAEFGF